MSLNQATLIGNLGRDPEVRAMQNGDKVCNLSLATSESWKDKQTGERKEKTEWHRVVVFGPLVNICEGYLHKGSKIAVQGKISTRKWTDQHGAEKYSTEIVLNGPQARLVMLDSKSDGGASTHQAEPQPDADSDIPF